jgi:Ca2+-binding RTX toxin-like protein
VIVAALLAASISDVANAANVSVAGTQIQFAARAGEGNIVTISSPTPTTVLVVDSGAPLTAGTGCTPVASDTATCVGGVTGMMLLDNRDDSATIGGEVAWDVDGQAGDDALAFTGSTGSRLRGSAGNDRLIGGSAAGTAVDNVLDGGPGDDVLSSGPSAETLDGGGGARDRVDYSARTAPVVIDNDNVADDGQAGEGDNVTRSVELIEGGAGGDVLSAPTAGAHGLTGNGATTRCTAAALPATSSPGAMAMTCSTAGRARTRWSATRAATRPTTPPTWLP